MLGVIVSEILMFEIFDLENLGQGHVVQHPQWSESTRSNVPNFKQCLQKS